MGKPLVTFRADALPKSIRKNITNHALIEGAVSREWWGTQAANLQNNFARIVRQGIVNGEAPATMAARITGGVINGEPIKGIMATSRAQARTLVKQSVTAAQNQTRLETLRANADVVKGVQQISTFDNRTTEICMAYSGGTWDLDGEPIMGTTLPFNNGPPHHWNCRSVLVPITKSYEELGISQRELLPGTRASMNGQVAADMSFDKWLKGQSKAIQIELLGQAKAALFRSGKLALRDLVDQTGRKIVLSSAAITEAGKKDALLKFFETGPARKEFIDYAVNTYGMKPAQANRYWLMFKREATPKAATPPTPFRPGSKNAVLFDAFRKSKTQDEFIQFAFDTFNMKASQAKAYYAKYRRMTSPKPVPGGPPAAPKVPVGPSGKYAIPAHYLPGHSFSQYTYLSEAFEKLHDMGLYSKESWTRFQKFLQIQANKDERLVAMFVQRDNVGDPYVRFDNLKSTIADLSKDKKLAAAARKMRDFKDPVEGLTAIDTLYYHHIERGLGGYTSPGWNHVTVYIKPTTRHITKQVIEHPGAKEFMQFYVDGIKQAVKTQLETKRYQPRWHVGPEPMNLYFPNSAPGASSFYQLANHERKAIEELADMLYSYIHEFGHQSHFHTLYSDFPPKGLPPLSQYGKLNAAEWHAENFVAYIFARDELLKKPVGRRIVKHFDEAFDEFVKIWPSFVGDKP